MAYTLKEHIVGYMKQRQVCPNYTTICKKWNVSWAEANAAVEELLNDKILKWEVNTSPKGRKSSVLRLVK